MRSCLVILFMLAGMAVGREMIYPPSHQYIFAKDGTAYFLAYNNWKIQSAHKWQVDVLVTKLDHLDGLRWFLMGYRDGIYDLHDFAKISENWTPPKREIFSTDPNIVIVMDGDKTIEAVFEKDPNYIEPMVVDPNEPGPGVEPVITFRISATTAEGGVYHLPSCRYVTETSRTITIEQAETCRPCKVCRPDEIDALLAEFLPGVYHEEKN